MFHGFEFFDKGNAPIQWPPLQNMRLERSSVKRGKGGLNGQREVKRRVKLGAGQPDRGIVKYHVKGGEGELSGGGKGKKNA